MDFDLFMALSFTNDDEEKEKLEGLGFKAEPSDYKKWYFPGTPSPKISLNSLEELMDFVSKFGSVVVDQNSITIYNGYLE